MALEINLRLHRHGFKSCTDVAYHLHATHEWDVLDRNAPQGRHIQPSDELLAIHRELHLLDPTVVIGA